LIGLPGLWGLWLGRGGTPDPGRLLLLLAALALLRALAWRVYAVAQDRLLRPDLRAPLPVRGVILRALAAFAVLLFSGGPVALFAASALGLGGLYLLLRRYSFLGELLLALALALAVPLGFAAGGGALSSKSAWLGYTAATLWASAVLMQHAALHLPAHIKLGVKSIAMLFGRADRWIIALLQLLALGAFALLGELEQSGIFMHIALAASLALVLYQQTLMAGASEKGNYRAWLNNLWLGLALLCGIAFPYLCACPPP